MRGEREAGLRGEQHVRHVLEIDRDFLQSGLLERLRIERAEARLLGLLRDFLLELLLDDGERHLALAESGDDALAQKHVQDFLIFALDFLGIGFDRKSNDARTRFFLLELHVRPFYEKVSKQNSKNADEMPVRNVCYNTGEGKTR